LGHTNVVTHTIDTGLAEPINLPPYRISPAKRAIIEQQIDDLLQKNIIEPASGPWAFPIVIVQKQNKEPRFCIDYRKLNNVTVKDLYPLPRIDDSLDFLSQAQYISILDLSRGYWQVSVNKESCPKTAFISHRGLFQFKVMPFGLCNAPATFQRLMNSDLAGLIYRSCAVYLDDIVVASPTFDQHLKDLEEVLQRLELAGLSLKLSKCQFCRKEMVFLGHVVSPQGMQPDPEKLHAILDFPRPKSLKQVRQFLGLSGYYHKFIKGYATLAEPLISLTCQDVIFNWDNALQTAFDQLKSCLTSTSVLVFPDFNKPFSIHTDASDSGLGAVLMQPDDSGHDHVIAYASRSEKIYSATEKECLAMIWGLEHFRPYIEGVHFTVHTDHSSLKWLKPTGQLAQWCHRLQEFDFEIIHKPGKLNKIPDALSRNPVQGNPSATDLLPSYASLAGINFHQQPLQILKDKNQREDSIIGTIITDFENMDTMEADNHPRYQILEDILYYKDPNACCRMHPMKKSLLRYFHDHPLAGYLGISKTLARLKLQVFWPGLKKDVTQYVKSCNTCQTTKPSQSKPSGLMIPITPQYPWEYVGVDFTGPLPRTQRGNTYILVFVDYFSKWVEVFPVKEATSQVAAKKFVEKVFMRHGAPKYLISDRGTPFLSDLFETATKLLGTEHRLTTAYHPQTNLTERVNHTLKTAIRAYIEDKHTTWDLYLPHITFALRTATHASTGHTPAFLLYGREIPTPVDLLLSPQPEWISEKTKDYADDLTSSLREAHEQARKALSASHQTQKSYYDQRWKPVTFRVKDLVKAKLAPVYSGPYQIIQQLSDVNYRLIRVSDGWDAGIFHAANMA
uniref:Gypsy retrotransposon integrase-like protein 1 n=1 Tax=Latimeria chalumnae TaxID=7897 RepID=H3A4B4_LATCH